MKLSKCLSCLFITTLVGCHGLNVPSFGSFASLDWPVFPLRSQSPEEDDEFETTVKTPMIGEFTNVVGLNRIVIQGVGLVTGLNGTGGDPPPSPERSALLEDMKRRGVQKAAAILRKRSTALVIVRAHLPPLIKKGDHFDVDVRLPGNSEAVSLSGGWLMETYLSEAALVPGQGVMKGHLFGKVEGPILISTGEDEEESRSALFRRGRVLGGGVSMKDRDMALYLRNDFRSFRNSDRISDRIGKRFYHYNRHGIKEPLAKAKTDQKVELKILERYEDNIPRYLQVVRNIAFRETSQAKHVRMQKLKNRLNDPLTSEKAAIELEAIGREAIPILKSGLKSSAMEVQFHSAVALAYLEDTSGLDVLATAARDEPAFRVFALAAMSVVDDAESNLLLQKLLNERSAETRYGAFRALTTMDKNDPVVRGENMNDQFKLHVLETQDPPLVHLTTRQKNELVLFGANQRLTTPLALRAGEHIRLSAAPGSDKITISRYQLGQPDRREQVSTNLAVVIRTIANEEFGASYPDVAGMLFQASKQHNLSSRLEIDALPESGRVYFRPNSDDIAVRKSKIRIGNENITPNLFESGAKRKTSGESDETADLESSREVAHFERDTPDSEENRDDRDSNLKLDTRTDQTGRRTTDKPSFWKRAQYQLYRFAGAPLDYAELPEDDSTE